MSIYSLPHPSQPERGPLPGAAADHNPWRDVAVRVATELVLKADPTPPAALIEAIRAPRAPMDLAVAVDLEDGARLTVVLDRTKLAFYTDQELGIWWHLLLDARMRALRS